MWIVAAGACILAAVAAGALLFWLYDEQPVRFRSGDIQLAGTLFLPKGDGAHPAAVFVHGSGRQSRREFEYHAKLLARNGIAALVYDKRGSGESDGETFGTDYQGYAADAAAAAMLLRSRDDIRSGCIGIVGHSEGGWVASIVASTLVPDLAFVIVTSTTPLSPASQVLYETEARLRHAEFSTDIVQRAVNLQRRVLQYQRTGVPDRLLSVDLESATHEPWFSTAELPEQLYPWKEYAWWHRVMDFDPVAHWAQVRAPVLAISGGRDLNSNARASQEMLRQTLLSGGNHDFTGVIFPNMEHGGVEWWLPGRMPPPRFPAGYPELLVQWIGSKVRRCS